MIRLPDSLGPARKARAARTAHSLSRRLLISVAVPLALFFAVMMLVLDSGFRTLSERQLHALLNSQIVTLIAAAEPDSSGGYDAPLNGLDARLASPDSLYLILHHKRSAKTHLTAVQLNHLGWIGSRALMRLTGDPSACHVAVDPRTVAAGSFAPSASQTNRPGFNSVFPGRSLSSA